MITLSLGAKPICYNTVTWLSIRIQRQVTLGRLPKRMDLGHTGHSKPWKAVVGWLTFRDGSSIWPNAVNIIMSLPVNPSHWKILLWFLCVCWRARDGELLGNSEMFSVLQWCPTLPLSHLPSDTWVKPLGQEQWGVVCVSVKGLLSPWVGKAVGIIQPLTSIIKDRRFSPPSHWAKLVTTKYSSSSSDSDEIISTGEQNFPSVSVSGENLSDAPCRSLFTGQGRIASSCLLSPLEGE